MRRGERLQGAQRALPRQRRGSAAEVGCAGEKRDYSPSAISFIRLRMRERKLGSLAAPDFGARGAVARSRAASSGRESSGRTAVRVRGRKRRSYEEGASRRISSTVRGWTSVKPPDAIGVGFAASNMADASGRGTARRCAIADAQIPRASASRQTRTTCCGSTPRWPSWAITVLPRAARVPVRRATAGPWRMGWRQS